jgi:hypothetical protein
VNRNVGTEARTAEGPNFHDFIAGLGAVAIGERLGQGQTLGQFLAVDHEDVAALSQHVRQAIRQLGALGGGPVQARKEVLQEPGEAVSHRRPGRKHVEDRHGRYS